MSEQFKPGDVVMLRSGGPQLTVDSVGTDQCRVMYWNSVTGLVESPRVGTACLRLATSAPETPRDANRLRGSSVAKSSLTDD